MAILDDLLTSTGQNVNPIEATLDQWNNETIDKLLKSLDEKASSGTTKTLRQSIVPQEIKRTPDGLSLEIKAEDYYKYIDRGVQGIGGENKSKGGIFQNVAPNSPFRYTKNIKPSVSHFVLWSQIKDLNPFAVRESVWRKGIKPNNFYSSVMTDEWIDVLKNRLEKVSAQRVEVIIINDLENGNSNKN